MPRSEHEGKVTTAGRRCEPVRRRAIPVAAPRPVAALPATP